MTLKKILFRNISILDENFEIVENTNVVVNGKDIKYIGSLQDIKISEYDKVIEGKNKLLMSGFVNSHCHLPMSLLRGYGENMNLEDWLFKKIFPFEEHLDKDSVYYATMLSIAEAIRFGTVSVSDMYYFMDSIGDTILESGIKGNMSRSISHFDNSDFITSFRSKEMMEAYEKYHNKDDGRLMVDMSLHSEYTTTPIAVSQLAEYTKSIGANMQVHVSETEKEVLDCIKRHGKTPVQYLAEHGLFDVNTTAAHCVWLRDEDYPILKEKNVTVATNPVSNLKLASGVCNVGRILKEGINLSIGTDGVASNNNLNFIEEMKIMSIGYKMKYQDHHTLTPTDILKCATINGSKAQGRHNTGLLKVGYRADLIVIDLDKPYMKPIHDIKNNLIYSACGTDVEITMVDGKILYEKGEYKTLDIEKISFEVDRLTKEILKKI